MVYGLGLPPARQGGHGRREEGCGEVPSSGGAELGQREAARPEQLGARGLGGSGSGLGGAVLLSPWLPPILPPCNPPATPTAAHTVFEAAKSRVYDLQQGGPQARKRKQPGGGPGVPGTSASHGAGGGGAGGGGGGAPSEPGTLRLEPVLERQPKWDLLREVLAEVQQERAALMAGGGDGGGEEEGAEEQQGPPQQQEQQQQHEQQQQQQQQQQQAAGAAGPSGEQRTAGGGSACGPGGQRLSRRATGGVAATSSAAAAAAARIAAAQAPVLVVCQDSFTCLQLREVLKAGGPATLLRRLYVDFLRRKWEGRRPGAAAADPGR